MNRRNAEDFFLRFLILISVCILCSAAYSGIIPADPDNPGKCIYRGDVLMPGETNFSTPCQRLTCNEDGSIQIEGCGKLRIENCNHGERINKGKPYPQCCILKYKCKKPGDAPYYIERDVSGNDAQKKTENST